MFLQDARVKIVAFRAISMYGGGDFDFGDQDYGAPKLENQGGFHVDNSAPEARAESRKDKQSLIPCTINQLLQAHSTGDNEFLVDGRQLNHVTIVGTILTAEPQNTNLRFTIDDGTGEAISVTMWIDSEAEELLVERRAQWREGKVVRVIGQLRYYNHTRSIVAFHIQPITNFDEYTLHFIEVVHTHLRHTKGKPGNAAGSISLPMMSGVGSTTMPISHGAPPVAADIGDQVLDYFKEYGQSEVGCTIQQCVDAMRMSGYTAEQVRSSIDSAIQDGHLYSTIDDDHLKCT